MIKSRHKYYEDKERWLPVVGFEDFYMVSDKGAVMNLPRDRKVGDVGRLYTGGLLKQRICEEGYHSVFLTDAEGKRDTKIVHRLVVEAFKPNTLGKLDQNKQPRNEVNHLDFNKGNNTMVNLVASSSAENLTHSITKGEGYPYHWSLLKNIPYKTQMREIEFWPVGKPDEKASCTGIAPTADLLGLKSKGVSACVNGRCKSSQGWHFRFKST